jgi:hypothetical protein
MSASASLRKSRCAAGSCMEIGSRAECRRRSSQCASLLSCTHRRRPLLSSRPRRERLVAGAASSRKRAAGSRGTDARAKTRPPATSACALPGRCALLWRCHSVPPCSSRIKLLPTNQRAHTGVKRTGIRFTNARLNGVAPATSAATSGMARFSAGLSYYTFAIVHILVEYRRLATSGLLGINRSTVA